MTTFIEIKPTRKMRFYCPECLEKLTLYHLGFTAIVCPNCKNDIKKSALLNKGKENE